MKIGFFLDWKVGTLDTNEQNNVLGEEILAMGFCNALKEFDDVESAEVYAPNFLPEEQIDYMIYMNFCTKPTISLAKKNICYVQNAYDEKFGMEDIEKSIRLYGYDAILCYSQKLLKFFKSKGYKTFFLPFGVDDKMYKKVPYDKKFDYEVAYVGNNIKGLKRTKLYLKPCFNFDFGLFGNWGVSNKTKSLKILFERLKWDFSFINLCLFLSEIKCERHCFNDELADKSQGKIPQEDMITLLNSSKILLNFTHQGAVNFDVMNYRILEIMACGGFVITDNVPVVEKYLKGCVVFSKGGRDLKRKIKYYLAHPEKRKAIAKKGYEYFQKHGTAKARGQELHEILGEI